MTLERALQKATSDESALVDAWKLNPHPRIAAVLRQLPASELFTGLFEGKLAEVAKQIAALTVRRHPHLSGQLERVLREPPWTSNGSRAVWGQIFSLITASKDPRFVTLAKELPPKWAMRSDQKTWMTEALVNAVAELPKVVELTEEQSALLQVIEREAFSARPPPKRSATIDFAAVYASPQDDGPRLVLADALLEQGEPRGEFLSLQLRAKKTPAEQKHEKTLLKTYARLWLAPFGTALGADVRWRRGFPAQGLVKFRDSGDAGKYGALPEWATLESLTWSPPRSPEHTAAAGFIGPAFRHLLRAEDVHLPHLLEHPSTSWALTWVRGQVQSPEALRALLRHPGLPKLQALHLTDPGFNAEWIKATTHWGPLQELGTAAPYHLLLLHVLAAAEASPLARLQWGEALRFHRAPDGSLTRLELLDWRGAYRVDEQLLSLPEGALSLMAPPDKNWSTGPVGRALERATAKHASRPSLAGSAARHLGLNGVRSMAWAGDAVWVSGGQVTRRVDAKTLEVSGPSQPGGLLAEHDVLFQRGDQIVLRDLATSAERTVVELRGLEQFQRSAEGQRLAVVKGSKVRVYEVATGELCFQCAGRDPVFDFRGRKLLVRTGPVLVVHDLQSKTNVVLESSSSTCFLADGRLAQRDRLSPVRVWRPGGEVLQLPALPEHHWAAYGTPDGARLAVVQPGSTQLFEGRTGQPLGQYPGGWAGLFAADGHFYVASHEQLTRIEISPES